VNRRLRAADKRVVKTNLSLAASESDVVVVTSEAWCARTACR